MTFRIDHSIISRGFDGHMFWAQARGGVIPAPDGAPTVIVTAQPALRSGSDVYYGISQWRSDDRGETWRGPTDQSETLGRREEPDGGIVAVWDMTPAWHAATGTLLSTGHTVRYQNDRHPTVARRRETAYSAYDPSRDAWAPWRTLAMPELPRFANSGAGSTQRVDLDDGTILLPVYHKPVSDDSRTCNRATVVRCGFDGQTLTYLEHGDELTLDEPRGYCEPSLMQHGGRFYLTLRNDVQGYVAVSDDGLHFETPVPWRFDDGTELGNYNTQQHWASHGEALFLIYTRRGLNNDHVMRHRAPLMMARVDLDRLCVIRETECELVPNRGARLGNFGVCDLSPDQTWDIVIEYMKPEGCEQYGSDNTIWSARVHWERPSKPQDLS